MAEVYIHEIAKVKNGKLAELRDAVRDEFVPLARKYGLASVGYWETAPSQGNWPETLELWEFPDFKVYLKYLDATRTDPALIAWQERKGSLISRSVSELCMRGPKTKTAAEAKALFSEHKVWIHEMVEVPPSKQHDYVRMIETFVRRQLPRETLGNYIPGFNNRLVINIAPKGDSFANSDLGKYWPGDTEYKDDEKRKQSLWMMLGTQVRLGWEDRFLIPIEID